MFWLENLGVLVFTVATIVGGCTIGYKAHQRFEEWYACRAGTRSKKTTTFQRKETFVNFAEFVK